MPTSLSKALSGSSGAFVCAAAVAAAFFGVVNIYSAVHGPGSEWLAAAQGDLWLRQMAYIISGIGLLSVCVFFGHYVLRYSHFLYACVLALLVLTLLIGADDATNTARWLWVHIPGIGGISVQPSELAKLAVIVQMAALLHGKATFRRRAAAFGLAALMAVLVMLQPALSAGLIILFVGFAMLFFSGAARKSVIYTCALGLAASAFVVFDASRGGRLVLSHLLRNFQMRRIETLLNPAGDAFLQTQDALSSIAAGGLLGVGFAQNSYIVHARNDFIFAIIVEQFGVLGAVVLLAVFGCMIWQLVRLAKAADPVGSLVCGGVAGLLLIQLALHIGVNTNMLPNTGVPLPLVSYGGSMIWTHMAAIGLCIGLTNGRKYKDATMIVSEST